MSNPTQETTPPEAMAKLDVFIAETESKRYKYQGAKERDIGAWMHRHFPLNGLHPSAVYYQRLNVVLDSDEFAAANPSITKRLRIQREG